MAWAVAARTPGRNPQQTRFLVGSIRVPLYCCLLLLAQPVFTGIFLGQVSLLITLLALLDALDLTPRPLRGVPTGLAAAIKLKPLGFIPYLWLTGRRRSAATAADTFVVCTVTAGLVAPGDSVRFWSSALSARLRHPRTG